MQINELTPQIRMMRLSELTAYDKNPRTHSEKQVDQIIASIREFGFTNPILVDSNFGIIAGHGRLRAAKKMKLSEVPVIVLSHLTDAQRRAYIIADNKLSLNAGWDLDLLSIAIQTLDEEGFDLGLLGFSDEEFKDLNLVEKFEPGCGEDEVPDAAEAKTKPGDIYQLGRHRLMCGDSTSIDAVEKLMNGERADMVFTDPPYGMDLNTDYTSYTSSKRATTFDRGVNTFERVAGDGNDFKPELIQTLLGVFAYCEEIFLFGADYYAELLPDKNFGSWIVWDKRNESESLDKMYGSAFELCWSKKKRKRELARVTWAGCFGHNKKTDGDKKIHPTMKPVKLIDWFFDRAKDKTNIVDLFGGSGSTLIACEKSQRQCFMMEIDPAYCDQIITRWEKYAGQNAELI